VALAAKEARWAARCSRGAASSALRWRRSSRESEICSARAARSSTASSSAFEGSVMASSLQERLQLRVDARGLQDLVGDALRVRPIAARADLRRELLDALRAAGPR